MRAAALSNGRMLVRDDVPEPTPEFGQVLVEVKACGICGSDLHFAKYGADMMRPRSRRWRHARTWAGRQLDLDPGRVHGPRVLRRGARRRSRHRRAGGRHARHVDPDPAHDERRCRPIVYSNDLAGGYGERMLLSAPMLVEVPNGLDARHAALTEPMAVGLHAVNRSGIGDRRRRPRARLRSGRASR